MTFRPTPPSVQIDVKGFELTSALQETIVKKLQRSLSHTDKIISVHVILKIEKHSTQLAHVTVALPGTTINAQAQSEDMYKTIDLLADNLQAQLAKHKEKIKHHD